ncbi:MAG: histidine--tRNA ligase [Dehalococcoidia bacterium]
MFRAPRGTVDVLPEEQPHWHYLAQKAEAVCQLYGYARIDTPIFEEAALFTRGVGETTDIVAKEMYIFHDRGGAAMALRPEGTANVCRAYLQHGMHSRPQPVRLYYWGPIFRYDRPQAGRQRQFTQFGVEAIGEADPAIDAEVIEVCWHLHQALGLQGLVLQLNSIGCPLCRPRYIEGLRAYYADKLEHLCRDCRARFQTNPLRLLDCKEEQCQPIIGGAPHTLDYLGSECADHFDALRRYLEALSIPFAINPRLVRGLDYYTRTVFEVQPPQEGAQATISAGGRYDGLIELLGGRPTPGVGFATGIERIILNLKRQEVPVAPSSPPRVFVAFQTEAARPAALQLASQLRRSGVSAIAAAGSRSLKSQMRQANTLGVPYVAIIGQEELAAGTVLLRRMDNGSQKTVAGGVVEAVAAFLNEANENESKGASSAEPGLSIQ